MSFAGYLDEALASIDQNQNQRMGRWGVPAKVGNLSFD